MGLLGFGNAVIGAGSGAAATNYFGTGADGSLSTTANVVLTSSQDGEMVVKNYQNLTINAGHTMTVSNRCRGLLLYVDGDLTVAGTLSMSARGASADPVALGVAASGLQLWRALPTGSTGTAAAVTNGLTGCGSAAVAAEANQKYAAGAPSQVFTIARTGANGGAGNYGTYGSPGSNGSAGQSGGGGAGGGAAGTPGTGGRGGIGTCFSGGPGGGSGDGSTGQAGSDTGGKGGDGSGPNYMGGVGNPGGASNQSSSASGTGGLLIIVVKGNVTIQSGGVISADGVTNNTGADRMGGSSGGGNVLLLYGGTYTNSGSVRANGGGTAGSGGGAGGAGGNGSVQTAKIANTTVSGGTGGSTPSTGVSTAYKFWRVRATDIGFSGDYYWNMSEFRLWTGADGTGTNIALTGIGRDNWGNAVALLNDGDPTGNNYTNLNNVKTWIGIELPAPAAISSFAFATRDIGDTRVPKSFALEGSNDGSTWITVQGYYISAVNTSDRWYVFNTDPAHGYRYWKIRPVLPMWDGSNNWCTFELKLYLTPDCSGTNVALASLGSLAMGPGTAAGLASLNDGNWEGSFAASGFNGDPGYGNGYFMIDLGATRRGFIKSLEFNTSAFDPARYPQRITIEKTKDGGNWVGNYGEYNIPSGLASMSVFQLLNIPSPNTGVPSV